MDKLNNLYINLPGGVKYDFAHVLYNSADDPSVNKFISDMKVKNLNALLKADFDLIAANRTANVSFMNANIQIIQNKLGLNDLLYRLETASKSANRPSILEEKLSRAQSFTELLCNFVLLIIHNLYWIKISNAAGLRVFEKSSIPLNKCYDFALEMGLEMTRMFEKRLNEEYSIANAIEEQFGIKNTNKKLNK